MTAARSGRRVGSLLAPTGDRLTPLLAALGALSFIAALLAVGWAAGGRLAATLNDRVTGSATIAVQAAGLESADAAAARAEEALAETPGVRQVRILEPAASDAVIASLMRGRPPDAAGSEIRLLAVSFAPRSAVSAASLRSTLDARGVFASVDDHRLSTSRLWRGAALTGAALLAASLALLLATYGVLRAAVRRCLTSQREVLRLLQMAGGTDGFIVRLLGVRVGGRAAWVAAAGAATAIVALSAWRMMAAAPLITWIDLAAALSWPMITILIASGAVAPSTRAALKHGP